MAKTTPTSDVVSVDDDPFAAPLQILRLVSTKESETSGIYCNSDCPMLLQCFSFLDYSGILCRSEVGVLWSLSLTGQNHNRSLSRSRPLDLRLIRDLKLWHLLDLRLLRYNVLLLVLCLSRSRKYYKGRPDLLDLLDLSLPVIPATAWYFYRSILLRALKSKITVLLTYVSKK